MIRIDNRNFVRRIKHPDAHQLACTVDEKTGKIEIKQGENVTVLKAPPGPVKVWYLKEKK